jgi:hypothetical protein
VAFLRIRSSVSVDSVDVALISAPSAILHFLQIPPKIGLAA